MGGQGGERTRDGDSLVTRLELEPVAALDEDPEDPPLPDDELSLLGLLLLSPPSPAERALLPGLALLLELASTGLSRSKPNCSNERLNEVLFDEMVMCIWGGSVEDMVVNGKPGYLQVAWNNVACPNPPIRQAQPPRGR